MKRLFYIKNPNGRFVLNDADEPLHFESKKDAKKERDALNKDNPPGGFVVALGPDHRNFRGNAK